MDQPESNFTQEDLLIRSRMEKMIGTYDKYMRRITFGREEELRRMTVDLAPVRPGDSVLEIGCATGALTMAAKRKAGVNGNVSAIDPIPGMIDLCREKAVAAGMEIDFRVGSIDDLPYADNQFDEVLCSFMIFHMSEQVRNKGLVEIFRVLKPGGRLLILDVVLPQKAFSRAILKLLLGFMLKHELSELRPKLESVGFAKIEIDRAKFRVLGLPLLSFLRATK